MGLANMTSQKQLRRRTPSGPGRAKVRRQPERAAPKIEKGLTYQLGKVFVPWAREKPLIDR